MNWTNKKSSLPFKKGRELLIYLEKLWKSTHFRPILGYVSNFFLANPVIGLIKKAGFYDGY